MFSRSEVGDLSSCNWHQVQWDVQKVSNFWRFIGSVEAHQNNYFTKYYGKAIIKFVKYLTDLKGIALDYGCGLGYLSECLLEVGVECSACDFSEQSVNLVNQKFHNSSLWKGAKHIQSLPLPYEDNSIDFIFCVETIEHIIDDFLTPTLNEFYRILKPCTGRLLITTPNDEDLDIGTVLCPVCNSVFHYHQHLRKFNKHSLKSFMDSHGFYTELSDVTDFDLLTEPRWVKSPLEIRLQKWQWILEVIWKTKIVKAKIMDSLTLISRADRKRSNNELKQIIGTGRHLVWIGGK